MKQRAMFVLSWMGLIAATHLACSPEHAEQPPKPVAADVTPSQSADIKPPATPATAPATQPTTRPREGAVRSPEISPDGRVTFRVSAPKTAKDVAVTHMTING